MIECDPILLDKRPIYSVWSNIGAWVGAIVGEDDVTRIEPYLESIDGSLWFLVWCGDALRKRLRASGMQAMCYKYE